MLDTLESVSVAKLLPTPYRGLSTFHHRNSGQFFGRFAEADEIRKFCLENSDCLLLVSGPSGCGKTSLIQAGLLQRFEESIEHPALITIAPVHPERVDDVIGEILSQIRRGLMLPSFSLAATSTASHVPANFIRSSI